MTFDIKLVLIGVLAYLIGCISPSIMIGKLAGVDIKKVGSGNAGTTNTLRVLGAKSAVIVLIVDILKGYVAVTLSYAITGGQIANIVAFSCVMLGHVFPCFYKFKGGKGVATGFGAALAIDFPSAFAMLLVAVVVTAISRKMSVGSMVSALTYPALIWYYLPNKRYFFYFSFVAALFILFTHRQNIKRLLKHEEPNLNFGPAFRKVLGIKNTEDVLEEKFTKADQNEYVEPEPVDYYAGFKSPRLKTSEKKNIAVVGNGSFGTAIANVLAHNGHKVMVYGRNKDQVNMMAKTRMNDKYLPYVILSDKLKYTNNLKTAVSKRDIVIFAVPAQSFRSVSALAAKYMRKDTIVVNLSKGIEQGTHDLMHEVAKETLPKNPYVCLSGPSHAEEVVRNYPCALVAASKNESAALSIQNALMNEKVRVYTHDDIIGVELGGSLKNVIAIATGISDGKKFGNNARAALMTRAIHEITRLGVAMGAEPETFSGLTGIGDLMVTCSTNLSRNRRCGLLIGLGLSAEDAVARIGSVVEGYYTAVAAKELAQKKGVEMPITNATYAVLNDEITPVEALISLMTRDKTEETN